MIIKRQTELLFDTRKESDMKASMFLRDALLQRDFKEQGVSTVCTVFKKETYQMFAIDKFLEENLENIPDDVLKILLNEVIVEGNNL